MKNILLIGLLIYNICYGQTPTIKFDHLTVANGLSNSTVNCILRDSKGFVWIGTYNGLCKFDSYDVTVFNNEHNNPASLSDNRITALIEDKDHELIVGTWNKGICIYQQERENFKRYMHSNLDKTSINSNEINCIYQDSKKNLWIGTKTGCLNLFNKATGKFQHFLYEKNKVDNRNDVYSIAELPDGNLLLANKGDGLTIFNVKTKKFTTFDNPNAGDDNFSGWEKTLYRDREGYYWVLTKGSGIYKFNVSMYTVQHFKHDPTNSSSLSNDIVCQLIEDKEGNKIIATDGGGINYLDQKTGKFTAYKYDAGNPNSISSDAVYCLYLDNSSILWVGTYGGGVNIFDPNKEKFKTYKYNLEDPNSLGGKSVLAMYQDKDANIWIGFDGGGLDLYNPKLNGDKFIHFKNNPKDKLSLTTNVIKCITQDHTRTIWMGTWACGLEEFNPLTKTFKHHTIKQNDPNSITSNSVWSLLEDDQHELWISSLGHGVDVMNLETKLFRHYIPASKTGALTHRNIMCMIMDTKKRIWLGTEGGGLLLYNRVLDNFIAYKYNINNTKSISNDDVRSIFEDSKGTIWVGTQSGGLNRLNENPSKTFTAFTEKDGLASNAVYGIQEDKEGNLWICTTKGLSKFNIKSSKFINYNTNDGIINSEFAYMASLKAKDGRLYFGGLEGFNAFYPEKIKENPIKPSVYIVGLKLFNKEVVPGDKTGILEKSIIETSSIKLAHWQSVITFKFTGINYTLPSKNQFAYRMEGFENNWNYVNEKREATYTNLDPGTYYFCVKASNNDGIWNTKGIRLKITITPPVWKSWWFRLLSLFLIIGVLIVWYRNRIRSIESQKKQLELQVHDRTIEINNQKEELNVLNDEIKRERDFVIKQSDKVVSYNEKLTFGLKYGKRIQRALLPSKEILYSTFSDLFILNKPKDVISGDFYWLKKEGNLVAFAVGDCTGHGVSGGFLSMLGMATLNDLVVITPELKASEVLFNLRQVVINSLRQTLKLNESSDGMNIGFCILNLKTLEMQFAGAYHPIYIINERGIQEIKGDKMPIGSHIKEEMLFTNHKLQLCKDDAVYLFSDGYQDQLGGEEKKRLGSHGLKQLLLRIQDKSMKVQRKILKTSLKDWKGKNAQIDDILIVGVKIADISNE